MSGALYEIDSRGSQLIERVSPDEAVDQVKRALAFRDPAMSWARARELAEYLCGEAAKKAPAFTELYGVKVTLIVPVGYALVGTLGYRSSPECPNCGRHRVLASGICEKCHWDADGDDYAVLTRPPNVCLICQGECDQYGSCFENHALLRGLGAL